MALNFGDESRRCDLGSGAVLTGLRTERSAPVPEQAGSVALGPAEGIVLVLD